VENNNSYVFISYAHKDAEIVLPCVEAMRKAGINIWYDDGIEAGSEWPEFIAERVMGCEKFVLFVSEAYMASQNCKRELNFAISRAKDILSIYIGEVNLSPGMEMQLGSYQAIYKKRFDSDTKFHTALCGEHYFDVCRVKETVGAEPSVQPKTTDNVVEQPKPNINPQVPQPVTYSDEKTPQPTSYYNQPKSQSLPRKNRLIAILLAYIGCIFGAHKLYIGQEKIGARYFIYLITTVWVYWSLFDFFVLLVLPKEKLKKIFGCDFYWFK